MFAYFHSEGTSPFSTDKINTLCKCCINLLYNFNYRLFIFFHIYFFVLLLSQELQMTAMNDLIDCPQI